MMEQHFEIKPGGRRSVGKAQVCMCPAVMVIPSKVVRPHSYVVCGDGIHKRDAGIW